jgi:circadian locomoter output cycle kaput protein
MIPLSNTKAKDFTSQLTLDWIYTFVDPRALLIVGYLPSELIKKSAYLFFHEEDLENVSSYHEMLVRKGRVTTCYYRFLTKGQSWIWLRSCCYVSYNQWNSKPEYVTSTTTSVSYDEVCSNQENLLQEDKLKFQNIYKKSDSESTKSVSNQVTPQTTTSPQDDTLKNPNTSVATKVLNGYNYSDKLPLMDIIKSGTTLGIQSQGEVEQPMDEGVGVDVESISSATSELDLTLSTMKAPDGLTPAQCQLHMQLQGKHKALEMSINHQIDELERIKKQIEINKQLWEFSKQLQEKKGSAMDQGIKGLNGIGVPTKRRGQTERSSGEDSNYEPHNKRLQANSEGIIRSYQVEMPVSHYIDIPAISLGDTPSMLYGMDQ